MSYRKNVKPPAPPKPIKYPMNKLTWTLREMRSPVLGLVALLALTLTLFTFERLAHGHALVETLKSLLSLATFVTPFAGLIMYICYWGYWSESSTQEKYEETKWKLR